MSKIENLTKTSNLEDKALAFLFPYSDQKTIVSFSGGKDSLVALDLALKTGIKRAVFCDTSIEFKETVDYVKEIESFYGIQIDVIKPKKSFFEMIEMLGFPSRIFRWCCEVIKFGPLTNYAKANNVKFYVTGLRKEESSKRLLYERLDTNPYVPVKQLNPLLNWSTKHIWSYIKKYNLPENPLYEIFERIGCWCCPYKRDSEWKKLGEKHPELIEELNNRLEIYADKVGIKDKKLFIEKRGWTKWFHSTNKITNGIYSLCNQSEEENTYLIKGNEDQIERIGKLIPIISDKYKIAKNKLIFKVNQKDSNRIEILFEKALNCNGCGVCISYCKKGALGIDSLSHLKVDNDLCNRCGLCISTYYIRKACVVRNYSHTISSLIKSD